jgi:hypothetical protein
VSKVGVGRAEGQVQRVVVEAATRFRPSLPPVGAGFEGPQKLKAKLALLVALNPEHFESRDVAAWTAYLRGNLVN